MVSRFIIIRYYINIIIIYNDYILYMSIPVTNQIYSHKYIWYLNINNIVINNRIIYNNIL